MNNEIEDTLYETLGINSKKDWIDILYPVGSKVMCPLCSNMDIISGPGIEWKMTGRSIGIGGKLVHIYERVR